MSNINSMHVEDLIIQYMAGAKECTTTWNKPQNYMKVLEAIGDEILRRLNPAMLVIPTSIVIPKKVETAGEVEPWTPEVIKSIDPSPIWEAPIKPSPTDPSSDIIF
jgi:hypothetical protein